MNKKILLLVMLQTLSIIGTKPQLALENDATPISQQHLKEARTMIDYLTTHGGWSKSGRPVSQNITTEGQFHTLRRHYTNEIVRNMPIENEQVEDEQEIVPNEVNSSEHQTEARPAQWFNNYRQKGTPRKVKIAILVGATLALPLVAVGVKKVATFLKNKIKKKSSTSDR